MVFHCHRNQYMWTNQAKRRRECSIHFTPFCHAIVKFIHVSDNLRKEYTLVTPKPCFNGRPHFADSWCDQLHFVKELWRKSTKEYISTVVFLSHVNEMYGFLIRAEMSNRIGDNKLYIRYDSVQMMNKCVRSFEILMGVSSDFSFICLSQSCALCPKGWNGYL